MDMDYLINACEIDVAPQIMVAIVKTESGGNPWVINDNTAKRVFKMSDRQTTILQAKALLAKGHNIDVGLAQINSNNLASLGLSVEEVIEPCTNLKASAAILKKFYKLGAAKFTTPQQALFYSFAAYNSGSFNRSHSYASKVWRVAFGEAGFTKPDKPTPYKAPIMVEIW